MRGYYTITMTTSNKKYFWRNIEPLWYKAAVIYELHAQLFYDEAREKAEEDD